MGQTIDKNENFTEFKNLNSSLKDYLFLNNTDLNFKKILLGKRDNFQSRVNTNNKDLLVMLSLSIASKLKTDPQQNCDFNTTLLLNKLCDNTNNKNEDEVRHIQKQIDFINKLNNGKNIFKKVKSKVSEKMSDKFSNSHQSSNNDNDIINHKNSKSELLTLNNSLDKNFQNSTLTQKKNFQNLEISKINTTKTANQTNIIDDDFGFEEYLKTETTRIKNNIKFDNYGNNNNDAFQTTINSKKKDSMLTVQTSQNKSQYMNDTSVDIKVSNINNKLKKNSISIRSKNSINPKSSINLTSKNNFDVNNSRLNRTPKYQDTNNSIIKNKCNNISTSPLKYSKTNQTKPDRKPVVNIKIDLRDIVREDIIDSYIQNTNSITSNSNLKNSLSPINKNMKAPFAQKKSPLLTPSKPNNFKSFVENCSNPNKTNFHLENAKNKKVSNNITKQRTEVNLNKSRDRSKPKTDFINSKSKPNLVKNVQMNKSKENLNKVSKVKNIPQQMNSKKLVCLDISDDGEIIDNTKKEQDNLFIFSPENKVKYQFKPRNKPLYNTNNNTSELVNDSFGRENSASFN